MSVKNTNVTRTVIQADAIQWLREQNASVFERCSIITSLPDISEFSAWSLSEWQTWFVSTAQLVMSKCPADGVAIFYQSDIKHDGIWIDKGHLIQKAAEKAECNLLAHKIVCRVEPGSVCFGRAGYSHLLCFSKGASINMQRSFTDVLPEAGATTWARGMGLKACELSCKMVLSLTPSQKILDPFCGHGTVLAVANHMGLNAIGVDLSPKCVKKARQLTYENLKPQS